tara:strand:- start:210 stop:530 length:321 start_codon:yes stop_codon:yes gene_type:complete
MTLDDLADNLKTALTPAKIQRERLALKAGAVRNARQYVPVVDGDLRGTIRGSITSDGIKLTAGSKKVHYAPYMEGRTQFMRRAVDDEVVATTVRIINRVVDGVCNG